MERLLNLLQEFYGENRRFSNDYGLLTMTNGVENLSGAYAQTYIISLKGGFIKWLVENDKIDYRWMPKFEERSRGTIGIDVEGENRVLMCLAISKHPIEDLLLYLK